MTDDRRYTSALAALDLRPGDRVLEIGCGHGLAVSLISQRLGRGGHIHAIDRSPKMVAAAARRNRVAVGDGVASFATGTVQQADFPAGHFDRVLAIRVRDIWTDAGAVLPNVRRWLQPDGRFCVVVDGPRPAAAADAAGRLSGVLGVHGFPDVEVRLAPGGSPITVIARP